MEVITIEEYNLILKISYTNKCIKHIEILDRGSNIAVESIWKEYKEYFKKMESTGYTEEEEETGY